MIKFFLFQFLLSAFFVLSAYGFEDPDRVAFVEQLKTKGLNYGIAKPTKEESSDEAIAKSKKSQSVISDEERKARAEGKKYYYKDGKKYWLTVEAEENYEVISQEFKENLATKKPSGLMKGTDYSPENGLPGGSIMGMMLGKARPNFDKKDAPSVSPAISGETVVASHPSNILKKIFGKKCD